MLGLFFGFVVCVFVVFAFFVFLLALIILPAHLCVIHFVQINMSLDRVLPRLTLPYEQTKKIISMARVCDEKRDTLIFQSQFFFFGVSKRLILPQ